MQIRTDFAPNWAYFYIDCADAQKKRRRFHGGGFAVNCGAAARKTQFLQFINDRFLTPETMPMAANSVTMDDPP